MSERQYIRVTLAVPRSVDVRSFVSALSTWLARWDTTIHGWGPEVHPDERGPLARLFARTERP